MTLRFAVSKQPQPRIWLIATLLCSNLAWAAPQAVESPSVTTPKPATVNIPISVAEVDALCDSNLMVARLMEAPLLKPTSKPAVLLAHWNEWALAQEGVPFDLLAEVHPDQAIRTAAEACELKQREYETAIFSSPKFWQPLSKLKVTDPVEQEAVKLLQESFAEKGAALPAAKRQQAKAIFQKLDKLDQDFSRTLRENQTKLAFTTQELQGVSVEALARWKQDEQGRYLVGFDYPDRDAIFQDCAVEATRKAYRLAASRLGGEENLKRLDAAVALRTELAHLNGAASFADWVTQRRMVGNPAVVETFLADLQTRVLPLQKQEYAELEALKRQMTGDPQAKLAIWDLRYYRNQIQKTRYQLDEAEIRRQFPTEPTLKWLLLVSSRLYGIDFRLNTRLPRWHGDVRAYDVRDHASGAYIGSFYLDLFPREGKYKHAAAFGVASGSQLTGQRPVRALITNFSRQGFNRTELETLFHEFGHILHGVLSQTRYAFNSGTNVRLDFVEAPSQMFEQWARRPESLALFAEACPSCQPVSPDLMARIQAAQRFGKGDFYAGQAELATFDLQLYHQPGAVKAMDLWRQIDQATPLGYMPDSQFPGTFAHIMGGYAAGYYSYLWSEVLALDMASIYGDNLMNSEIGQRYRATVLERGGEVPPMQLVHDFLGRDPSSAAFIREVSGAGH